MKSLEIVILSIVIVFGCFVVANLIYGAIKILITYGKKKSN